MTAADVLRDTLPAAETVGHLLRVVNVAGSVTAGLLCLALLMVWGREPDRGRQTIALGIPFVLFSIVQGTLRQLVLEVPPGWGVPSISAFLVFLNVGLVRVWQAEPYRRRWRSPRRPDDQEDPP